MMEKEKQIEEMAETLAEMCDLDLLADCEEKDCSKCMATALYNAGYRKQSEGEWVSVEDRLPDNNTERVLVFLMDDDFTKPIGENKIDTDRFVDGKWVRWSRFVTHWRPMPDPPRQQDDRQQRI